MNKQHLYIDDFENKNSIEDRVDFNLEELEGD